VPTYERVPRPFRVPQQRFTLAVTSYFSRICARTVCFGVAGPRALGVVLRGAVCSTRTWRESGPVPQLCNGSRCENRLQCVNARRDTSLTGLQGSSVQRLALQLAGNRNRGSAQAVSCSSVFKRPQWPVLALQRSRRCSNRGEHSGQRPPLATTQPLQLVCERCMCVWGCRACRGCWSSLVYINLAGS
jgi:hypothetical protein